MKKIVASTLVLVLLATSAPLTVFAACVAGDFRCEQRALLGGQNVNGDTFRPSDQQQAHTAAVQAPPKPAVTPTPTSPAASGGTPQTTPTAASLNGAPCPAPIDDSLAGSPCSQAAAADAAADQRKAELTDAGQQVGCSSDGEFGGAVANALGSALQNIVSSTLLGKFNQIGQKIASKAGPFAPLVSKAFSVLGNIATQKINSAISGIVSKITGQVSGVAGQALSQVGNALGISGLGSGVAGALSGGAAGIAGAVGAAGIAGVGLSVPVNEVGKQLTETEAIHKLNTSIDHHADQQEQTQKALAYKECVSDPLVAKIKNALLAFITRSMIDWANNGFDGGSAFIQNLQQFIHEGVNAAMQDFIDNNLSGICTPYKQDTQRLLLTQYQYNDNYGQRSQCGLSSTQQAAAASGQYDQQTFYAGLFGTENNSMGAYLGAEDEARTRQAEQAFKDVLDYTTNGGVKNKQEGCRNDRSTPSGSYCVDGHVTVQGDLISDQIKRKLGLADQQLISADEIGEIIDALMQSLTQVAFQGVDGLMGLSKKSGNQGSYLDQAVGANVGDAGTSVQNILSSDLQGALDTEQTYHDTLGLVVADLTNARSTYVSVIACYKPISTSGTANITAQTALDTMTLASTTISQVIDPQLTEFNRQLSDSSASIEQLQNLIDQATSAITVSDYNAVSNAFTALKQSGTLHNATDLNYLVAGLDSGVETLEALLQDSNTRLAVCQAP